MKYEGVFSPISVPDSAKGSLLDGEITLKVVNGQLFGPSIFGVGPIPLTPLNQTEFGYEPLGVIGEFITDDSGNIDYNSFTVTYGEIQVTFQRK